MSLWSCTILGVLRGTKGMNESWRFDHVLCDGDLTRNLIWLTQLMEVLVVISPSIVTIGAPNFPNCEAVFTQIGKFLGQFFCVYGLGQQKGWFWWMLWHNWLFEGLIIKLNYSLLCLTNPLVWNLAANIWDQWINNSRFYFLTRTGTVDLRSMPSATVSETEWGE